MTAKAALALRGKTKRLVPVLHKNQELKGHSVERMYLRQRPKSENWASLTLRSSASVRCTEKSTGPAKLPGLWLDYNVEKQYLSAVHPVACSLLWMRCLFDRLRQIFDFQIFRFRHLDCDPDRAQKLISSSVSRHSVDMQNFIQIHARVFE